jgi:hypothetical protein
VINHPFRGDTSCDAGKEYVKALYTREEQDIHRRVAAVLSYLGR